MPSPYTPEQRAGALELYAEHGPAEASRRSGVPSATIRQWAHRAGITGKRAETTAAATRAARVSWAERRARIADSAGAAAETFLDRALNSGAKTARLWVGSFAACVDRAALLSGDATSRTENVTDADLRERARQLREQIASREADELAARRDARSAEAS